MSTTRHEPAAARQLAWSIARTDKRPQFADYVWNLSPPTDDTNASADPALIYLDEQLKARGPRSVIYISFGSLFWPVRRPELLDILVASLPKHMGFLMSNASAMSGLSPEQMALWGVTSSGEGGEGGGKGMVVPFAPQWRVLRHPAVAWFVVSPPLHRAAIPFPQLVGDWERGVEYDGGG